MKLNIIRPDTPKPVRFRELNGGDWFVHEGQSTPFIKIGNPGDCDGRRSFNPASGYAMITGPDSLCYKVEVETTVTLPQ